LKRVWSSREAGVERLFCAVETERRVRVCAGAAAAAQVMMSRHTAALAMNGFTFPSSASLWIRLKVYGRRKLRASAARTSRRRALCYNVAEGEE
jgi:hypothetical protein